jgi:hypothetical protein
MLDTRTVFYLRNARTLRLLDGPYYDRRVAEHEANRRNHVVRALRLRQSAVRETVDLIEVVGDDRERLAA